MTIIEGLYCFTVICNTASAIGLLTIYRSYEKSLLILVDSVHILSLNLTRSLNGAGIQRMAEDTEVAE